MDSTAVTVALITSGLGLIGVLAGIAAKVAIESRRLHLDVAKQLAVLSDDVGRKNGRGPVTRMVEELLDRTERIESKVNDLEDRVTDADADAAVVRKIVLDLIASRQTGGRRSTDPKGEA